MGEARARQTRNQRHIALHPYCVYCGGRTAATQVDHVPPIALFTLKRRPEGLEFSACEDCHAGTRKLDLIASVASRLYPNPKNDAERAELHGLVKGLFGRAPNIAREIGAALGANSGIPEDLAGLVDPMGAAFTMGPALIASLEAFGARLVLALHYMETKAILPEIGAIGAHVYTNVVAMRRQLPEELLGLFQQPRALFQKGISAEDDFTFDIAVGLDTKATLSYCTFRTSFAIVAFCADDEATFGPEFAEHFYRPGFLKGLPL